MKAKFGAIIVAGSGKIGGHVASRNRAGAYIRTKVTPVNPSTSFQAAVRNRLTEFSQAWRALTEAQRQTWNNAVQQFSRTDVFGDIKNPSGINLFQRLNNNLGQVGIAPLNEAPLPGEVAQVNLGALTFAETGQVATVALSGAVPANTAVKVLATPQLSPGINFIKNQLKLIQTFPAATPSPLNIAAAYTARVGALVEGQKVVVAIEFVNTLTGQVSGRQQGSIIVAA